MVEELDLLIKMLGLTTSSNDNVALVAMRKANKHLSKLQGSDSPDWDSLLRGKVKVVEDPFKNAPAPSFAAPNSHVQPRRPVTTPTPDATTKQTKQAAYANVYGGAGTYRFPHAPPPPPPPPPDPFLGLAPILGNTYPIKDEIKKLGGKWDKTRRIWYIDPTMMPRIYSLLSQVPSPKPVTPKPARGARPNISIDDLGADLGMSTKRTPS
jgi:hypothetical protein